MQLASFNIATAKWPPGSPEMSAFESMLDSVHEIAERSPGFVWRMKTDDGSLLRNEAGDLLNVAMFRDIETLENFTFNTIHKKAMRRSDGLFEHPEIYHVMWWVYDGHRPTVEECYSRLKLLREEGPTVRAFTWDQPFSPTDSMLRRERAKKQRERWAPKRMVKATEKRKKDYFRGGSYGIENSNDPPNEKLTSFIFENCSGKWFLRRIAEDLSRGYGVSGSTKWSDIYYFELEEDAIAFKIMLESFESQDESIAGFF